METLFIYLVKSSGLIGIFYLSYYILLRKETFFTSNRWFLLAGLITSVVLPLVVFTKIVWVDPSPTNIDWSRIPVTNTVENEAIEINWYLVFAIVYSIGILVFLIKFAFDFYSLSKILKGKTIQKQADFKFIDVNENIAPFSYFNSIVYNSLLYSDTELENILEHEKIHSSQNHTIDVLISSFFCVAFWFNPLVWLYKKAIVQNLEFIADSEASKNISDKKAYQLTLLKITTQENCVVLTNHFYQSLIKKRIVMLNKNQSNKRNYCKYALVLPILGAFVFFFQVKVVAQEKVTSKQESNSEQVELKAVKIDKTNLIITKNTTDEEIKEHCEQIKKLYNIDLTFFNIKRNSNGEIISIESKNKDIHGNGTYSQSNSTPIKPFKFFYDENKKEMGYIDMDLNSISKGKAIIINGQVSSQDELEKLNPNEIKSIAVNTKTDQPTMEIDTKNAPIRVKITDKDIYIDGVKATNAEFSELDPNAIDKVEVNTFENNVKITTKTINISADNFNNKKTASIKKPLIVLNGKKIETTIEDLNKLDPNLIQSMNVLKGQKAIDKYGINGENGVIEIITKENAKSLEIAPNKTKKESELDKSEIENSGNETVFSKERWLEMYKTIWKAKHSLEKMNTQKDQAKVELEKAKQSLKSKLFS